MENYFTTHPVPVRTRTLSGGHVRRPSLVFVWAPSTVELRSLCSRATGQKVVRECVSCCVVCFYLCLCRVRQLWFGLLSVNNQPENNSHKDLMYGEACCSYVAPCSTGPSREADDFRPSKCIPRMFITVLWNNQQMKLYAVNFIPLLGSLYMFRTFYVYGSVHHNIFYEITNRCSYMQSILFHC